MKKKTCHTCKSCVSYYCVIHKKWLMKNKVAEELVKKCKEYIKKD